MNATWAVLHVAPGFYDTLPSLVVVGAPDVTVDLNHPQTEADGERIESACNHVPFLLLPIAARPDRVRVVFADGVDPVGEAVFDCRTQEKLSEQTY